MGIKQFYLHLSQAGKALQKARNNNYSDQEKQAYQGELLSLYDNIIEKVKSNPNETEDYLLEFKRELDFIFKSLEFLDSSTLNLIPYETVECLKCALHDWVGIDSNYIIVTSLINAIDGFSFDPTLVYDETFYDSIFQRYKIKFAHRLVQINIPKALSRDYLVSVVHYHELGHFVDTKYSVTDALSNEINDKVNFESYDDNERLALIDYFPFIFERYSSSDRLYLLQKHLGEYFCDLFACQYVGKNLNEYLMYLTENQTRYSYTHPSSYLRQKVVNDFSSGKTNLLIELINKALMQIVEVELTIRFEKVSTDDFYQFIPPIIENEAQLHGIYSAGWEVWKSDWVRFQEQMQMNELPEPERVYTIINNLIEKSIGNYIVNQRWKQGQIPAS